MTPRAAARLAAAALCLLALAGCASLFGRRPEREIAVDLPVSRSEAVRRTLAVLREQGYRVRETLTSGTEPETEPFRHGDDAEAVFRASVAGDGGRARVVLSGTYRRRAVAGLVLGREREVRRDDDPLGRELWARLDGLAAALRRTPRDPAPR